MQEFSRFTTSPNSTSAPQKEPIMGGQNMNLIPPQLWTVFNPKKGSRALSEFRGAIEAFKDTQVGTVFTFLYPGKGGETLMRTCTVGPRAPDGLEPAFWDRIRLQNPLHWPAGEFHLQEVNGSPLGVFSPPQAPRPDSQTSSNAGKRPSVQPEKKAVPKSRSGKRKLSTGRKFQKEVGGELKKSRQAIAGLWVHLSKASAELAGLIFLGRMMSLSAAHKARIKQLKRQLS